MIRFRQRAFIRPLTALVLPALLLGGASLQQGCAFGTQHTGRPINDSKVSQIVKGKTTIDDVITLFGAPQQQTEMAGNVLYIYRYTENKQRAFYFPYTSTSSGEETSDELTITFDKATGTVKTYSMQKGIRA